MRNNPVIYEISEQSVNIAGDDVTVKKQEENRVIGQVKSERGQRKYVHNTIFHVSKGLERYILNGKSTPNVLIILIAFIFYNNLIGNRFQFFTDGQKSLNKAIIKAFSWYKNIGIILDWFHLEKKCKEKLSLALKGRVIRNQILDDLMPLLWYGLTDRAIINLKKINKVSIKNQKALKELVTYLGRNRPIIPCYAVRKELGLCNSSAIGEKMNDLVVSDRQKHNGMSWSKKGSVALASVTALKRNNESRKWFEEKEIDFKLAA